MFGIRALSRCLFSACMSRTGKRIVRIPRLGSCPFFEKSLPLAPSKAKSSIEPSLSDFGERI